MEAVDIPPQVSGVIPATEGGIADTPPQLSGVTPAAEGSMEPPKAAEGIPAAEGGLTSGVTPAVDPKAVSTERSPWEGLSGEVSPWEGLTGYVPEQEEEGAWTL